jgi:transcriptional regulator with XRE-family HTH domain
VIAVRRFRKGFTAETESIREERLAAEIGQSELARAIGKSGLWLYKREAGLLRLHPEDARKLRRALADLRQAKG